MSAYIEAKQASLQRKERFDYNTLTNTINNAGNLINDFAQSSANKKAEEWAENRNTELTNRMQDSDFFKDEEGNWLDFNGMKEKINSFNEEYLLENPLTKIYGTRDKAFSLTKNKDNEVTLLAQKYYIDNIKQEQAIKAEEAFNNILNTEVKDFALETEMLIDVGGYENGYSEEQIEWATNAIYGEDTEGNTKYVDFKCFKLSVELKSLGYKDAEISKIVAKARDEFAVDIFTDLLVDKYVDVLDGTSTQWDYDKFVTDSINLGEIPGYSLAVDDDLKASIKSNVTAQTNEQYANESKKTQGIFNQDILPLIYSAVSKGELVTTEKLESIYSTVLGFNPNLLSDSTKTALHTMTSFNDDVNVVANAIEKFNADIGNYPTREERDAFINKITNEMTNNQIGLFIKAKGATPWDGSYTDYGIQAEFNKEFGIGYTGQSIGGITGEAYSDLLFSESEQSLFAMDTAIAQNYRTSVGIEASNYASLGQHANAERAWNTYFDSYIESETLRMEKEGLTEEEISKRKEEINSERAVEIAKVQASKKAYDAGLNDEYKNSLESLLGDASDAKMSAIIQLATNEIEAGNIDEAERLVIDEIKDRKIIALQKHVPGSAEYKAIESKYDSMILEKEALFDGLRASSAAKSEAEKTAFIEQYKGIAYENVSNEYKVDIQSALDSNDYAEAKRLALLDNKEKWDIELKEAGDDQDKIDAVNAAFNSNKEYINKYYSYLEDSHNKSLEEARTEKIKEYVSGGMNAVSTAKLTIALEKEDYGTAKTIELEAAKKTKEKLMSEAKTKAEKKEIESAHEDIKEAIELTYSYKQEKKNEKEAKEKEAKIESARKVAEAIINMGDTAQVTMNYEDAMESGDYDTAEGNYVALKTAEAQDAFDSLVESGISVDDPLYIDAEKNLATIKEKAKRDFATIKEEDIAAKKKAEEEAYAAAQEQKDREVIDSPGTLQLALYSNMINDPTLSDTDRELAYQMVYATISYDMNNYSNPTYEFYDECLSSLSEEDHNEFMVLWENARRDPEISKNVLSELKALCAYVYQKQYGVTDINLTSGWENSEQLKESVTSTVITNFDGFSGRTSQYTNKNGQTVRSIYDDLKSKLSADSISSIKGFANSNDSDALKFSSDIKGDLEAEYFFGLISSEEFESSILSNKAFLTEDHYNSLMDMAINNPFAILKEKYPSYDINEVFSDAIGLKDPNDLPSYLKSVEGSYYTNGFVGHILPEIGMLLGETGQYTTKNLTDAVNRYISDKGYQLYDATTSIKADSAYKAVWGPKEKSSTTVETPPATVSDISSLLITDNFNSTSPVEASITMATLDAVSDWKDSSIDYKNQGYGYQSYNTFMTYTGDDDNIVDIMALGMSLNAFGDGRFSFKPDDESYMATIEADIMQALNDMSDDGRMYIINGAKAFKVAYSDYNNALKTGAVVDCGSGVTTIQGGIVSTKNGKQTVTIGENTYDLKWATEDGLKELENEASNIMIHMDNNYPEENSLYHSIVNSLNSSGSNYSNAKAAVEAILPGETIVPYLKKNNKVGFAITKKGSNESWTAMAWSYCPSALENIIAKTKTYTTFDYGFNDFYTGPIVAPLVDEAKKDIEDKLGIKCDIVVTGKNHSRIEVIYKGNAY